MQRNSFQDVVPPGGNDKKPERDGSERRMGQEVKRSVRDIPVMRRARPIPSREPEPTQPEPSSVFTRPQPREEAYDIPRPEPKTAPTSNFGYPPPLRPRRKLGSPKFFIGVATVLVLVFVILIMNVFTSARVEITPKTETASFNAAIKISNTATTSALGYQVIELSADREKEVPASGEEQVERKASAKITVYNNFSKDPQRLIARTRFATPDGLIFRINDSITIPGKSGDKPGSLEVTVYADEAGEKYNVGLVDFTIPGFQTDAERYKGFYARSVTKAEGGFIGKAKKVSDADKAAAKTELETLLKADIEKNLTAQLDPTLVVLKGGIMYEFSDLPGSQTSGNTASLKESVKAYAIAFKKSDLSSLVENQFLPRWQGLPAEIASYENMQITFDDSTWKPNTGNGVTNVKISGSANMVAAIDTAAITNRLAGKQKAELLNIINDSPSIVSAKAAIRPVWKGSFPENPDKVTVEVIRE